jgi:hypothetical protein
MYIPIPHRDEGINIQERLFIISADLGQANDYTAISVIESITTGPGVLGPDRRGNQALHLRHIERPSRGTEYPTIVDRILELYHSPKMAGFNKAVVIDLTGLGRPVFDIMKKAGFQSSLSAISITGGMDVTYTSGHYNVPKRDLVINLQVLLQNGGLKIAKGLKEADILVDEMINFQTKINDTGRDTYGGRSGVHDDIVLSVAMGAWLASRRYVRWGNDKFM